jgi:predicted helicase
VDGKMPEANSDWTKKVDDLQHSLNQRIQETMDGKMPEANSDWTKKADDLQHSLNQRIQETVDGKMLEANSDIYIYIACIHTTYLLSLFEIAI